MLLISLALATASAAPLDYEQALAEAVQANVTLLGAAADREVAEGRYFSARGVWDPVFTANLGASLDRREDLYQGALVASDRVDRFWGLGFSQTLPTGTSWSVDWANRNAFYNYNFDILGQTVVQDGVEHSSGLTLSVTQQVLRGARMSYNLQTVDTANRAVAITIIAQRPPAVADVQQCACVTGAGPREQAAGGEEGPEAAALPDVPDGVRGEGRARGRAADRLPRAAGGLNHVRVGRRAAALPAQRMRYTRVMVRGHLLQAIFVLRSLLESSASRTDARVALYLSSAVKQSIRSGESKYLTEFCSRPSPLDPGSRPGEAPRLTPQAVIHHKPAYSRTASRRSCSRLRLLPVAGRPRPAFHVIQPPRRRARP